ncbi:TraB/VirB10 family protein [Novosphingobium album (ex Liu et al. 2023)]|uniref:TraB/VirB10 family protein n=1 Tax=Novosphingobium album (ex Liu et al. 2023) TaxID=3031130 RepID=A0ABT5WXL6_9SPHN|nr:TraB/VirB10 family protein [Novosphingobium album (ex Liu et al. 2023)]MDE8654458.1 TraB/VirB10 family protein [Novosphingobium album (ex Liu et al. 2023)]
MSPADTPIDSSMDPMHESSEPQRSASAGAGDPSPYQAHLNRVADAERQAEAKERMVRPSSLLDVKAWWRALSAKQQLRCKQAGIGLAIALLGYGLYTASSASKSPDATPAGTTKLDMGAGLRGDSLETKLHGDLQAIRDGQQQIADRVTAIEEGKVTPGSKAGSTPQDMGELPAALPDPDIPGSPPVSTRDHRRSGDSEIDSLPVPPTGASAAAPAAPPAPPVEKTVGAIGAATSSVAMAAGGKDSPPDSKKKIRTIFLPPGFMKARLLTGIDALASKDATQNPEPLIARVQAPAVLPNDVKANLAGCFVIGNATGSLAKERVEVQLVSLSCVDFDEHSVVDQPIKGFFVDTDGKKGLSGKVVTRAGAALARSFIAGTVSGFASAVEGSFGSTSTSALGSVRTLDAGDAAKTSIAGGLSKSSDKLTDFYLDLARQAGPIVEVGAAKDVVVVIQEGVTLEIKPTAGVKF